MGKVDILFIAANARSLVANRGDLIRSLVKNGLKVGALVPKYDYLDTVNSLDIAIWTYNLDRHSTNPIEEVFDFLKLRQQIADIAPSSVFAYAIKPVTFGVLAARLAGVRNIYCLVTGLGYLFASNSLKARLLRQVTQALLDCSAILSKLFIFQNSDDQADLNKSWLFRTFAKSIVVNGSGVDLQAYPFSPISLTSITFICVARLIEEKGIREFAQAAAQIKARYPSVSFWLLGGLDTTLKNAISSDELEQWRSEGSLEVLGKVKDVRPYLQQASVMVLPSYYREGIPRSILEAMSMGRPIITCNTPGCRETVENGVNGYLIPPRNAAALRDSMVKFIENPTSIRAMGSASRQMAEERFDVVKVNQAMMQAMALF
jgi:glycosyltransferase involved in cell wall biosynthesis